MPVAEIRMVAGREQQTKARLIGEVTEAIRRVLGVEPSSIRVILIEVPPENWAVGGVAKSGPSS